MPRLFGRVLVPGHVVAELSHRRTPAVVRDWVSTFPGWLKMGSTQALADLPLPSLGDGERAAIALALSVSAALLLTDDRAAAIAARAQGLVTMGTLGLLDLAARAGLADLADAFRRLRATNFRCRQQVMDDLLALYEAERRAP